MSGNSSCQPIIYSFYMIFMQFYTVTANAEQEVVDNFAYCIFAFCVFVCVLASLPLGVMDCSVICYCGIFLVLFIFLYIHVLEFRVWSCFALQNLVSFLVLQLSLWGRGNWLFYFNFLLMPCEC